MRIEGFKLDYKMVSSLVKEMGLKSKFRKKKSFTPQKDIRYGYLKKQIKPAIQPVQTK